ncbi:MAG: cytochrome c biogenesis protein CcsA [Bacteroidota bacterium]|jgi:cytochrome c-type biogenesis protein CcmF
MVGTLIVYLSCAAAAVSAYSYYRSRVDEKRFLSLARNSYGIMTVGVIAASVMLMVYILGHQFEYDYVWAYSSRSLPLHLLITTFWAGQEGSFLLWALCGSIIGIILMAYTRRKGIEADTMTIFGIVQGFLLLLLIAKSPFQFVWNAHPDAPVGMVPQDGRGLNPLLQNFWMIAHPPILFAGFAMMAVPFVFAVGALWRRTYLEWIPNALPWVIAGTIALGTGIMLGGYWAYGVLGWGGWWGWDPVENSSLIPWMIGIILIHTMLVQRKTGGLAKTNFFLGICTYVLVVYSTFLTRSGILGSASVHSFVDPGAIAYTLLVVWIGASLLFGFGMLIFRWKDLSKFATRSPLFTRESLLAISAAVMGASAFVILFGTSRPLLSGGTLEPSFYDKTNLPIAIALGFLLAISLVVQWKEESSRRILKNSAVSFLASGAVVVVLVLSGLHDILIGLFAFTSLFAFFVNFIRLYTLAKENIRFTGGAIAHIGLAILFLGIIGSGHYGEKKTASLTMNEPKEVLGHQLTFKGSSPMPDGKWKFSINVVKGGSSFDLEPVMYQSDYNNSLMRNPDYATTLTRDFYIEPVSLEEVAPATSPGQATVLQLKKGETKNIGDVAVTFVRFDMDHKSMDPASVSKGMPIGVVLNVNRGTSSEQLTPVTLFTGAQSTQVQPARTKDGSLSFELLGMNVDTQAKGSVIELNVTGLGGQAGTLPKSELLVIEASVKPFMSLVWAGALLMIVGLGISLSTKFNSASTKQSDPGKNSGAATGEGNKVEAKELTETK